MANLLKYRSEFLKDIYKPFYIAFDKPTLI